MSSPANKLNLTAPEASDNDNAGEAAQQSPQRPVARSENHPVVPFYVRTSPQEAPAKAVTVLGHLGMTATRLLTTAEMRALHKPPVRILTVADDACALYAAEQCKDEPVVRLRGVTAADVKALYERAKFLETRSAALAQAAEIAGQQYAVALSDLHDVLLRMRRQVMNAAGEWPEVTQEWKLLLDFFSQIYPGPGSAEEGGKPEAPVTDGKPDNR